MSVPSKSASPEAGLALLLGPTWSLVLKSSPVTLGRATSSDKPSSKASFAHTKLEKSDSSFSRSQAGRRRLPTSSSHTKSQVKAEAENATKSPLYWIMQWAKQQPAHSSGSSEALFDDTFASQSQSLDNIDIPSFASLDSNGSSALQPGSSHESASKSTHPSSSAHGPSKPSSFQPTQTGNYSSAMAVDEPSKVTSKSIVKTESSLNESLVDSSSSITNTFSMAHLPKCGIDLGPDPTISRQHATVSYDPDLCIWDISCHSSNGILLNGRSIYPRDGPALLPSKSRVQIGSVLFYFLLPTPPPSKDAAGASSTSSITASTDLTQFIVDEDKYVQSTGASQAVAASLASKKRKRSDRSIVPLRRLDLVEESQRAKRKSFGDDIAKRSNSMRSILFGLNNDEDAEEEAWRRFLDRPKSTEALAAPHLSATFDPALEEYREGDRLSKYTQQSVESIARAAKVAAVTEAISDSKVGSRGPRSNKPSEGTDASGVVYERPKLTYGQLIHLALESSSEKRMLFPEIADYIEKTFPYFTTKVSGNWHNTVRQQLSHTPDFVRQERTATSGKSKGKGGYWALSHWYEGDTLLPRPK